MLANIRWNLRRADSADTTRVCGQARLIPWTPVNLIAMSLLALALPDVERTAVATLDSFEDVAEIFERNLPNQVRHSAPEKFGAVWFSSAIEAAGSGQPDQAHA